MEADSTNINKRRGFLLNFYAGLISLILSLILLEFMSAIYFEFFSEYYYVPLYLQNDSVYSWRTEFEPWGAWHKPNAKAFHRLPCFAVNYTSNSIGARDVERASPGAPNSAIFLGDSFIEGFGVRDEERLSNIFERRTGKASINLGAGGDLGPLQYLMLYEAFAPQFSHDTVVIGFLPANDFTDNDWEFWKHHAGVRYRPYYKKTASGYEIFYKGTFENGRTFSSYFTTQLIAGDKSALLHYTWMGGFLFAIRGELPARSIDISIDVSNRGYFETSRKRLEAAYYFLEKIIRSASEAKVYILIIPTYSEAKELRARSSPWVSEFIAKFQSRRVSIIDLGPMFARLSDNVLRSAFLQCNGHWSALANAIAADALLKAFAKSGPAPSEAKATAH